MTVLLSIICSGNELYRVAPVILMDLAPIFEQGVFIIPISKHGKLLGLMTKQNYELLNFDLLIILSCQSGCH